MQGVTGSKIVGGLSMITASYRSGLTHWSCESPADVSLVGTPVQLGTGPQSMLRGRKSENGMIACIPCPPVRMTISADWSPLS
jgi:hypothetical protein